MYLNWVSLAHSWALKAQTSKEFIRTAFQQKLVSSLREDSTAKKNNISCIYLQYTKVIYFNPFWIFLPLNIVSRHPGPVPPPGNTHTHYST